MTKNNEQIINTTKCKHNTFDGGNTQREICLIDNKYCDGIRADDCYFKQLNRKEQECEELKKELESTKGLAKIRYQCLEAVKELANNANLPNISLYIDSFLNEEPQKK